MRVLDDGRLLVAFTTKAGFNGKFIFQDAAPQGSHLKMSYSLFTKFHETCQY